MSEAIPEAGARLLSTQEAAGFLGLSPRTLERWRWRGQGPRCKKYGGKARYTLVDIQTWVDAQPGGGGRG